MESILYRKEGKIGIITLNHPKALNALNAQLLGELDTQIDVIEKDKDIHVLIITGEGRAFAAGADISAMVNFSYQEAENYSKTSSNLFRKIELMTIPVIAAINGFALGGGCELAMGCDIRVASENAKFGQPETKLGLIPGFGGTQRLPRLIGTGKAKEMIFTGEMINAQEAEKWGLVNKIVPPEVLMETVIEIANKIIDQGPIAVNYAKLVINQGMDTDLERGLAIEVDYFAKCFETKDQKEGTRAFLEKRKPNFIGE